MTTESSNVDDGNPSKVMMADGGQSMHQTESTCDASGGSESECSAEHLALIQTDLKVKNHRLQGSAKTVELESTAPPPPPAPPSPPPPPPPPGEDASIGTVKPESTGKDASTGKNTSTGEKKEKKKESTGDDASDELAKMTGTTIADTDRSHDHCKKLLSITDTDALTKCSCNASSIVKLPSHEKCPSACPFTQAVEGESCFKLCVWGDACPDFHMARKFASTRVMECVPTCGKNVSDQIPGCLTCADFGKCATCIDGFKLGKDGKSCDHIPSTTMVVVWNVVYVLLGIVILFLVALTCVRPTVNPINWGYCLDYMQRCLPSHVDHSSGTPMWSPHPVFKTNLAKTPIGGVGTMLMFRFLIFATVCTLVLTLAVGITFETSTYDTEMEEASNVKACPTLASESNATLLAEIAGLKSRLSLLEEIGKQVEVDTSLLDFNASDTLHLEFDASRPWALGAAKAAKDDPTKSTAENLRDRVNKSAKLDSASLLKLRRQMFWVLGSMYILLIAGAWAFGWHILKVGQEFDDANSTMKDFALSVTGLPHDLRDPQLLEEYLKSHFGNTVVGVSIAYDYNSEHSELVEAAIDSWLLEEETKHPLVFVEDDAAAQQIAKVDTTPEPSPEDESTLKKVATFKYVDGLILGEDEEGLRRPEILTAEQEQEVINMLKDVKCSGKAYAVFSTQKAVEEIMAAAQLTLPLFDFHGMPYKIKLSEVWSEPEDIQWWYHCCDMGWNWKIPMALLICLVTMIIYFVSLIPLVKVYMGMTAVPGAQVNFLNEILLGALPGIGGAVMCIAVDLCSEWVGYHERDRRDVVVGLGAFALTCVTVVGDLYLTLQIAQGSSMDSAFAGSMVSFDAQLARELYGMLVPAYILCVAVVPTLAETNIPYFLFGYIVKTRPVPRRMAEKTMKVSPFENIYRYSDTISGICAMWTILFFISPKDWQAMSGCVLMVALQYSFSQWMMLRFYARMSNNSERLAWHGLHWWGVPLCMLFAAALMWGVQAEVLPYGTARYGFPTHFLVYFLGLKMIKRFIPERDSRDDTYTEVASILAAKGDYATMFNTNPIHCLKMKYLSSAGARYSSGIVPWALGKEHLQQGAPYLVKKQTPFCRALFGDCSWCKHRCGSCCGKKSES